jgi:putative endonuclease
MWWVYVLECRGGRLYTGATLDLPRRLAAHAAGRGGRFTRAFPPVRLRAVRACASRGAALALEARIKHLPARSKIASLRHRHQALDRRTPRG